MGNPSENETVELGSYTMVDEATGDKYTGGKVRVNSKNPEGTSSGSVTITPDETSGTTRFVPGAGNNDAHVEYTTKDGKVDHTVSVPANSYVDFGISGTGNGEYQAKPNSPTTEIEIDGVTFTGNGVYNLDHPMDAGVTAQVPGGKSVEVTGSNDGEFKVENKSSTDVTVTGYAGNNHGSVELSNGQEVNVTVGDGKPTNFKAAKDGTELGLNTVKDGDSTRDVVELKAGAVTLPADATKNQSVYVNGVDVENTDTDSDLTVTMDKPTAGNATVTIPENGEADIGGVKYKGPAEVVVDSTGKASIADGTVKVPDYAPGEKPKNVEVQFPSGGTVTVTNDTAVGTDPDRNIEVTAPGEGNLGKATVQPGGKLTVTKGEKTTSYTVPEATAGGKETVFGFDDQGNVTVEKGAISLEKKDDSIGFGDATLAKGSEGRGKITVTADENSDRAKVTVPAGETLTATDKDGKEHTYTNNGSGELELEVDEDGNVYVEKLPDNGFKLGADMPIIVEDKDGRNDNPLIAGENGATLKPDGDSSNPPILDSGSIIFPEKGGKSNVMVPQSVGEEVKKKLEGSNVEIAVGEDGNITASANQGTDGKVAVEGGTTYTIPEGTDATLDTNGVFSQPAMGEVTASKDGPGSHPYALRPTVTEGTLGDKNAKTGIYTDSDQLTTGDESAVHMDSGSNFSIHEKVNDSVSDTDSKKDNNLKTAIGEYTAGEGGADVTVDHEKGSVTLKSGTLTVKDTNKDPNGGAGTDDSKGASVLIPGEKEGESVKLTTKSGGEMTVTAPGEGYKDGADVVVPAGQSVTVTGKDGKDHTYTNSGSGELELHVNPNGSVELKSGKVELGDGDFITVNGVTYTGPATVEKMPGGNVDYAPTGNGTDNKSTATFKAEDGKKDVTITASKGLTSTDDSDKLNIDANSGDKVKVDGQVYEAEGTGVQLTVDKKTGDVTLEQGKLKVSEGDDTADSGLKVQTGTGTGTGKDYTVTGDAGVEVDKDDKGKVTVTVPSGDAAGNKDVTVTGPAEGQTNKYTNESETGEDLVVELTDEGPVLKDGKAGLGEGSSIVVAPGSDGSKPATVESTKDGDGDKKVTVEKSTDGKPTAVDIPDGGKAKVNGVEVEGPAKVVIDEDGTAHVTPKDPETDRDVKVGGKTYTKKDDSKNENASMTITPDGTVTPDKVGDFIIEIVPDPDTVIELKPGETVTFTVDDGNGNKKTTTLTGGDEGGFVKVDKDGTVTVTDATGAADYGKYQNAGADGSKLELEISGNSTELKGGTVQYGADDAVKLGDSEYKAGSQGATLTYGEGAPTLEDGSVKLDDTAGGTKLKVKTGDEQAEMTGKDVEVFADGGNGNPAVVGTEASKSGEVEIYGTTYGVPSGNTKSPVEGSGTSAELGAPATGQVSDKLGEPGDTYVIVPKDTGNIYGGDRTGGKSGKIRDWLIPANPAYYDLEKALRQDMDRPFIWKQSCNISVGDRVYIYMAAPERRIRYKCEAVEVNIPHAYEDGNVTMKSVMRLKLLRRYDNREIGVDMLRDHGGYAVRGPRSMPGSLIEEIERIYWK